MTYGQLPNITDNELLAAYPDRSRIQETIKHIRLLIGELNHKENTKQQEEENKVITDLQPGDLVLARVLPRGANKLGNKYRRNIYKITQRICRKLKITAQFGNLEVVTIHVKNAKKFKFGHDLAHLPKAIRKFFHIFLRRQKPL